MQSDTTTAPKPASAWKAGFQANEWLTTSQCAEWLGLSARKVRELVTQGRLPCVQLNARTWRFHRDTVVKYIR